MDRRGAEYSAAPDDQTQLETARPVESRERTLKEVLPKADVRLLHANQFVKEVSERATGDDAQFSLERKVENFIQDECPGECGIVELSSRHVRRL